MVARSKSELGAGVYSVPEAARILRAHHSKVRRWIDEARGLVPRHYDAERRILSFVELMELHFIKMFRDEGVSLQAIRPAAAAAAKRFKTKYPFAVKRFDTDGKAIFATLAKESSDEELIEDLNHGQYVFSSIVRPFFKKLDYGEADIERYWPMTRRRRVVIDPARQFGRPIDSVTGIPTKVIFDAFQAQQGQSVDQISEWFDLPRSAVEYAIEFEQSHA